MNIIPLVSDSLGVRSLSVFVEFNDGNSILIDGGARIAPKRYGLPPSGLELITLERYQRLMEICLEQASHVVISHYHYDHYLPDSTGYQGKTIFLKDVENKINRSQKTRGTLFRNIHQGKATMLAADGREFRDGDMLISFSCPVPHGEEDSPLGYVLMTMVQDLSSGKTLLHTSDVQGPVSTRTTNMIIDLDPDIVIMDGAPTYLREWQDPSLLQRINENLDALAGSIHGKVILDHHDLRDREWSKYSRTCKEQYGIRTYADYYRLDQLMLESKRNIIWRSENGRGREAE